MRSTISLVLFVVSFSLIACSGEDHDRDARQTENPEDAAATYETPAEFRQQVSSVLDGYFELKDALVESDTEKAASHAQIFHERLEDVSEGGLSDEARSIWTNHSETLAENSNLITGSTDIEEQREAFDPLSMALIQSVEAFGPFDNAVYQQTCPMFGDGSADWLSTSEEIENPYFGKEMLNCGEVVRNY
ncbi:MAG: DUF3347 domain-containing protein [Balneolales bacterium]